LIIWIFSKFIPQKQKSFFIMELPVYQAPRLKNVLQAMYSRSLVFVTEAGKIILAISILLWALATYGPAEGMQAAEIKIANQVNQGSITPEQADGALAAAKLEASYAGIMGKAIEPAIRPLGYDWKIGIALITSFAAREVFVGTISTIYNIGAEDDDTDTVKERLRKEINPETGKPMYTPALGGSLIVFYIFAMQCISTIATTYKETKSVKWTVIQFAYMTIAAWVFAFLTFRLLGGF
jgi:ferrous iron transport protein B